MEKNRDIRTYLTVFFVTCMVVSNIATTKQVQLPLGIVVTGGVLVFPFTYILSDVFSECYGYHWSRVTCYMAFAMNLFAVLVFQLMIALPAAPFWGGQDALAMTLGSVPRILVASLSAYVFGDLMNDKVFRKMKNKHKNELNGFGIRAVVSSIVGETCDSLVFYPIAFLGEMPVMSLVQMAVVEVTFKVLYEVAVLPLTTQVAKLVNKVESDG
jgi:uncharacterized integral membrane protein (TIGR00697 family)